MTQSVIDELKLTLKPDDSYYDTTWHEGFTVGNFRAVAIIDDGDRRWVRGEQVIVQHLPSGHYYAFAQDIGLTENQDSTVYDDDVWPVDKTVKVVETVEWVKR